MPAHSSGRLVINQLFLHACLAMWTAFFPRTAAARPAGVGGKQGKCLELHHLQKEPLLVYVASTQEDETSGTVIALIGAQHDAGSNPAQLSAYNSLERAIYPP